MQRSNILGIEDLGIASLYLWEIAGGIIPALTDPAPQKKAAP